VRILKSATLAYTARNTQINNAVTHGTIVTVCNKHEHLDHSRVT